MWAIVGILLLVIRGGLGLGPENEVITTDALALLEQDLQLHVEEMVDKTHQDQDLEEDAYIEEKFPICIRSNVEVCVHDETNYDTPCPAHRLGAAVSFTASELGLAVPSKSCAAFFWPRELLTKVDGQCFTRDNYLGARGGSIFLRDNSPSPLPVFMKSTANKELLNFLENEARWMRAGFTLPEALMPAVQRLEIPTLFSWEGTRKDGKSATDFLVFPNAKRFGYGGKEYLADNARLLDIKGLWRRDSDDMIGKLKQTCAGGPLTVPQPYLDNLADGLRKALDVLVAWGRMDYSMFVTTEKVEGDALVRLLQMERLNRVPAGAVVARCKASASINDHTVNVVLVQMQGIADYLETFEDKTTENAVNFVRSGELGELHLGSNPIVNPALYACRFYLAITEYMFAESSGGSTRTYSNMDGGITRIQQCANNIQLEYDKLLNRPTTSKLGLIEVRNDHFENVKSAMTTAAMLLGGGRKDKVGGKATKGTSTWGTPLNDKKRGRVELTERLEEVELFTSGLALRGVNTTRLSPDGPALASLLNNLKFSCKISDMYSISAWEEEVRGLLDQAAALE